MHGLHAGRGAPLLQGRAQAGTKGCCLPGGPQGLATNQVCRSRAIGGALFAPPQSVLADASGSTALAAFVHHAAQLKELRQASRGSQADGHDCGGERHWRMAVPWPAAAACMDRQAVLGRAPLPPCTPPTAAPRRFHAPTAAGAHAQTDGGVCAVCAGGAPPGGLLLFDLLLLIPPLAAAARPPIQAGSLLVHCYRHIPRWLEGRPGARQAWGHAAAAQPRQLA